MLVQLLYFIAIMLFAFVICGAAQLPNGILLVISLFPVFLALILGCMMWIVAAQEYGLALSIAALLPPLGAAIAVRRISDVNLCIAVWSTAAVGLVFAYIAILLADPG